ncbi:MAG TPA: M3 family oligoendopeptidase, partial [Armatimonadota bacterium]|nr:M3 family oligoendopeptidase [Armatimonadota bacterium]
MFTSLPSDARTLLKWSWTEIQTYYDELAQRTLDASNVAQWLADWTALDDRVSELQSRHEVMTSQNTADKQAEEDYNKFLDTIYPRVEAASQKLREKLIASGLEPENFQVPLKKMRAEAALFREANLPLLVEEHKLSNRFDQIVGAQTVEWDGKEVTISQLRPVLLDTDRSR